MGLLCLIYLGSYVCIMMCGHIFVLSAFWFYIVSQRCCVCFISMEKEVFISQKFSHFCFTETILEHGHQ